MPRFISAHVTTCMTRQDLDRLLKRLLRDSDGPATMLKAQADTRAGRLVCEWQAPDREALLGWLGQHQVRLRGPEEWVMRVEMESADGRMVAPSDSDKEDRMGSSSSPSSSSSSSTSESPADARTSSSSRTSTNRP